MWYFISFLLFVYLSYPLLQFILMLNYQKRSTWIKMLVRIRMCCLNKLKFSILWFLMSWKLKKEGKLILSFVFLHLCFVAPFSHFVTIITRTSFCVHLKDHNFLDAHQLQWVKNKLICSCNLVEYISFFIIICIIFAYICGCSSWVGQISLLWIINSTWSWYGLSLVEIFTEFAFILPE